MPLLYLPLPDALFLWGEPSERARSPLPLDAGSPARVELITPEGRRQVDGVSWPVATHAAGLASLPAAELATLSASAVCWVLASKLAVELVARARVVPTVASAEARWAAALGAPDDAAQVLALARSMPIAAHAVPAPDAGERDVWAPDALLRAYLDSVVDSLLRAAATQQPAAARANVWQERWRTALSGSDRAFPARGFGERSLHADLQRWSEPALGARDKLRACFRLELPEPDREQFVLRFMLQSPDDASLLVPASEVWEARGRSLPLLGRAFRDPQESLLEALGRAARLFPPLSAALTGAKPSLLELDAAGAWQFLGEAAALLDQAGFGVIVPGELTRGGQRRLRLRMRVGGSKASRTAGVVAGAAALAASELVSVDWQAAIGDEPLSAKELAALAAQKAPLVRYRGAWVAIDPSELPEIQARIRAGGERVSLQRALQAALAGEIREGQLPAQVVASGELAQLLERLRDAGAREVAAPAGLHASLRPYQARGLAWLSTLSGLGLGACLADDMGLGKTLQLLACLLHQTEAADRDRRPALLVAPTSVVGNWEREAARFAPQLRLVAHYGDKRAREPSALQAEAGALVLTTFGLLRRDAQLLAAVDWGCVALDEAQNIKNSASATARAARELRAPRRVALTGTPVENRLAELWSILEFANPGLLGPLERFKREFALPIERYGDEPAAARLRRIAGPFVLRRLKSDPAIIQDLPAKNEAKVICTLTREQASLYKAVLDEDLRGIEEAQGIERRGRVLALLTALKQVCNHPAQYLGERAPLAKRSGKLSRLSEMLEEALAAGDKALVFSQYREMGERLVGHLEPTLGVQVGFLHGGTAKAARDSLVQRFQTDPLGPRVLVLSLKAGGTGLNLTAANHVFHYDRWWNPAVEDQATDRAYRIGQTRAVQVHKFICAGTVEDKVDQLLERKRELAQKVVGSGEQWITELGDAELRELFTLGEHAVVEGDDDSEADGGKKSRTRRSATRTVSRPSRRP